MSSEVKKSGQVRVGLAHEGFRFLPFGFGTLKRSQRVTPMQKEIYVAFIEENEEMRHIKHSDTSVQVLWEVLTGKLNAVKGPVKDKEEWKKVFDNWRYVTMKKKRAIVADLKKIGGGPVTAEVLTQLEERAISSWGNIVVEGNIELPTAGFSASSSNPSPMIDADLEVIDGEYILIDGEDDEQ